ncbi:MAG: phosphoribosylamine--glycine ligase [Chloroflexi bacterium]|nr:phosphoribosylamine--glycine ligase [Chloroflexota bacterium]
MRVLVVGGGGREHALAWKIAQSPRVAKLFVAPGNAGTAAIATNLPISASNIPALLEAAKRERIDLAVIGPESPLTEGIVDIFTEAGIPTFGPSRAGARIEGSKAFARDLMVKHGIPCARGATFSSLDAAAAHIRQQSGSIVVKADGLAAGKGVFVTNSQEAALQALSEIMEKRAFGDAGNRVIIEECLMGKEVSLLAFSDGETVAPMVPACDYKRAYDGDQGLNTGGMGCYSPPGFFDDKLLESVKRQVLEPTVRALAKEGSPYRGVLYAGLMLTDKGIKVLEFNARFGDPETQVILPRLKSDLVDILLAVVNGTLAQQSVAWSKDACVGVVLASGGYPGSYTTGYPITGLDGMGASVTVFHAGTKLKDGQVVTDGGRVLNVVACGKDLREAREKVYKAIPSIRFQDCHYRQDIALREVQ